MSTSHITRSARNSKHGRREQPVRAYDDDTARRAAYAVGAITRNLQEDYGFYDERRDERDIINNGDDERKDKRDTPSNGKDWETIQGVLSDEDRYSSMTNPPLENAHAKEQQIRLTTPNMSSTVATWFSDFESTRLGPRSVVSRASKYGGRRKQTIEPNPKHETEDLILKKQLIRELETYKKELKAHLQAFDDSFVRINRRPPTKVDKEPIRHLYEVYHAVKTEVTQMKASNTEKGKGKSRIPTVVEVSSGGTFDEMEESEKANRKRSKSPFQNGKLFGLGRKNNSESSLNQNDERHSIRDNSTGSVVSQTDSRASAKRRGLRWLTSIKNRAGGNFTSDDSLRSGKSYNLDVSQSGSQGSARRRGSRWLTPTKSREVQNTSREGKQCTVDDRLKGGISYNLDNSQSGAQRPTRKKGGRASSPITSRPRSRSTPPPNMNEDSKFYSAEEARRHNKTKLKSKSPKVTTPARIRDVRNSTKFERVDMPTSRVASTRNIVADEARARNKVLSPTKSKSSRVRTPSRTRGDGSLRGGGGVSPKTRDSSRKKSVRGSADYPSGMVEMNMETPLDAYKVGIGPEHPHAATVENCLRPKRSNHKGITLHLGVPTCDLKPPGSALCGMFSSTKNLRELMCFDSSISFESRGTPTKTKDITKSLLKDTKNEVILRMMGEIKMESTRLGIPEHLLLNAIGDSNARDARETVTVSTKRPPVDIREISFREGGSDLSVDSSLSG